MRLWLALIPLCLAGCGSGPPTIVTEQVTIRIGADLNDDRPIPVDLVYVADKDLADQLTKLSAHGWFSAKSQYLLDFPKSLAVHHWEPVPHGRRIIDKIEGDLTDSIAAFLFADYATPGNHRARLDLLPMPVVTLKAADFTVAYDEENSQKDNDAP